MEKYKAAIIEMIEKMQQEKQLKWIYSLVLQLYIHEN